MTLSSERVKAAGALIEKLRTRYAKEIARASTARDADDAANEAPEEGSDVGVLAHCFCHHDAVLRELVRSYVLWESTTTKADSAMRRIDESVVDINELRVCLTEEVASILGSGLSRIEERATRLRATLNDIFQREHSLRLSHLAGRSRKDARQYLFTLASVPEFVAARVALLRLGIHAMPVDERTLACLRHAKAINSDTDIAGASALLERAVKSGEGLGAHRAIQAWADDASAVVVRSARPSPGRKLPAAAAAGGAGGRTEAKAVAARPARAQTKIARAEKPLARAKGVKRAKKTASRRSDNA